MVATKISATNLRSQTRDVIERVRFRGEHFIVLTFGKPVAVIISVEEYNLLLGKMEGIGLNACGDHDHMDHLSPLDSLVSKSARHE